MSRLRCKVGDTVLITSQPAGFEANLGKMAKIIEEGEDRDWSIEADGGTFVLQQGESHEYVRNTVGNFMDGHLTPIRARPVEPRARTRSNRKPSASKVGVCRPTDRVLEESLP